MINLTTSQFKRITISFAIIALLIQAITYTFPFEIVLHFKWLSFSVLYVTTLISAGFLNVQLGEDPKKNAVQMVILSTVVKIILLYLANQLGKKISKLSLSESEYFLAIMVNGQNILKSTNVIPSAIIKPMAIQVNAFILLLIPEYKI